MTQAKRLARASGWARHTSLENRPEEGSAFRTADFPEPAGSTLDALTAGLRELLGANLQAMYVFGSLAFGCYHAERSDVDVLVLTRRRLAAETREPLSELLRSLHRLEITFVSGADIEPWRHPCPFDYHFSSSGVVQDGEGADLATEITNARARGIPLIGPPPAEALPEVPAEDYLDCVIRDVRWARERIDRIPSYAVLNACRTLAYARKRTVLSKAEGGEWGLRELPAEFRALVEQALAFYRGAEVGFDPDEVRRFSDWVEASLA